MSHALGQQTDAQARYAAMDWLVERQAEIEKKLAKRHLLEGGALVRVSSTYFEGECCPNGVTPGNGEKGKFILYLPEALRPCNPGCTEYVVVVCGAEGNSRVLRLTDREDEVVHVNLDDGAFLSVPRQRDWRVTIALLGLLYGGEDRPRAPAHWATDAVAEHARDSSRGAPSKPICMDIEVAHPGRAHGERTSPGTSRTRADFSGTECSTTPAVGSPILSLRCAQAEPPRYLSNLTGRACNRGTFLVTQKKRNARKAER